MNVLLSGGFANGAWFGWMRRGDAVAHEFVSTMESHESPQTPAQSETEKILGQPSGETPPPKIDSRWREHYNALLRLRDRLLSQHRDLTAKAREIQPDPIQDEPAEIGTAEFQRELAFGQVSQAQEMLNEIENALDRIDAGTYGVCERTGKPIPLERLAAVPWTRFSVEAQEEIEETGGGIRPNIGDLGETEIRGHVEEPPPGQHR